MTLKARDWGLGGQFVEFIGFIEFIGLVVFVVWSSEFKHWGLVFDRI